jgi:hypothetical protein
MATLHEVCNEGVPMSIDVRKLGVWLLALGAGAMTVGIIADAVRTADDPTLATREGIFDLSGFPHALFFGGICVAVLGLFAIIAAKLYRPSERVTVGRRLLQVGAPLAAIALFGACASVAGNSALADPSPEAAEGHAHDDADAAATEGDGHAHDDGGAEAATGADGTESDDGHAHESAVVPPKPYDPTQPIDLGGVPGVTPEQQARAENLIAVTLARLPQWADYKVAEAAGFKSIGDALTGDEHFINTANFTDAHILDPDHPESLVYKPNMRTGEKTLVAAMYMLNPDQTLDDVPDIGGKLTQWHIHNNLCFTAGGQVAGLTSGDGSCRPPLVKGSQAPMIHVWITPHPCGPFAALEGVGAGQIKPGEERLCDEAHGAAGA